MEIERESIVGNNMLPCNIWFYLRPNNIKCGSVFSILWSNSMNINKPIQIIIIRRLHKQIELLNNLPIFNSNQTNLADTPTGGLSRFKINCCESIYHYHSLPRPFLTSFFSRATCPLPSAFTSQPRRK